MIVLDAPSIVPGPNAILFANGGGGGQGGAGPEQGPASVRTAENRLAHRLTHHKA